MTLADRRPLNIHHILSFAENSLFVYFDPKDGGKTPWVRATEAMEILGVSRQFYRGYINATLPGTYQRQVITTEEDGRIRARSLGLLTSIGLRAVIEARKEILKAEYARFFDIKTNELLPRPNYISIENWRRMANKISSAYALCDLFHAFVQNEIAHLKPVKGKPLRLDSERARKQFAPLHPTPAPNPQTVSTPTPDPHKQCLELMVNILRLIKTYLEEQQ